MSACCSSCNAFAPWNDAAACYELYEVRPSERLLCERCVCEQGLELDECSAEPDWLYVVYPSNPAADMWCTRRDRYVTDSFKELSRYLREHADSLYRLSVGIERRVSHYANFYRNCIVEAIAHGGPPARTLMDNEYLAYVWETHRRRLCRRRVLFRVTRIPDRQAMHYVPGDFESADAFCDAVHAHVGESEWFGCEMTPCGLADCAVPTADWEPLYIEPRAHITWVHYEDLRDTMRADPAWRIEPWNELKYIDAD